MHFSSERSQADRICANDTPSSDGLIKKKIPNPFFRLLISRLKMTLMLIAPSCS